MKLQAITRAAARARKAYAHTLAFEADELSDKARKRLERRTRATRRAMLESIRAADALDDFGA